MKSQKTITQLLQGTLFLLIMLPQQVSAATLTVPDDHLTIQLAIDAANPGDTVFVRAGTYYENVFIEKSIILQGEDRETTIIDGGGTGIVVLVTGTSGVTITGFTVRNCGSYSSGGSMDAGIALRYASSSLISDCIVTSNELNGLYSYYSSHNTIQNCDFSDNGPGSGLMGAIHFRYSPYNTIAGNNIYGNTSYGGITARSGSSNTVITGNHVYSNKIHGIHVGHSSYCTIANNITEDNLGYGVDFDSGVSNTVTNNVMSSNSTGIAMHFSATYNTFVGNVISANGSGISIWENSGLHVFYHNDIVGNTTQVGISSTRANSWDSGYPSGGNYWSDYAGADSSSGVNQDEPDSDEIGDTPYVIDAANQDNYPLMGRWNRQIVIDIKPGSDSNSINLGSHGGVPVAIFSTDEFDASTVDPVTITLAGATVRVKGKGTPMASLEDADSDGLLDLVVHVETEALELTEGDVEAVLEGMTFDGTPIQGTDSIRIVP